MKLVYKCLLLLGFIIVGSVGTYAVIELVRQDQALRKDAIDKHKIVLESVLAPMSVALWNYDPEVLEETFRSSFGMGDIEQMATFDRDGKLFSGKKVLNQQEEKFEDLQEGQSITDFVQDIEAIDKVVKAYQENKEEMVYITRQAGSESDYKLRFVTSMWFKEEGEEPAFIGYTLLDFDIQYVEARIAQVRDRLVLFAIILGLTILLLTFLFINLVIIKRVKSLEKVSIEVAKHNYVTADNVTGNDEITSLTRNFNHMVTELVDYSKNLEQKVEERSRQVMRSKQKIQDILNNIEQGILTFGSTFKVDREYSQFLLKLFNKEKDEEIFDIDIFELFINKLDMSSDSLNTCREAIFAVLDEIEIAWDMNEHLLPREAKFQCDDGSTKYLSIDWKPMFEDEIAVKLMLSIRDLTSQKELEEKIAQANSENERMMTKIKEILSRRRDLVDRYLNETKERFDSFEGGHVYDQIDNGQLFISLHTIKGGARTFGFVELKDKTHEAEELLQSHNDDKADIDKSELVHKISDARKVFDEYFSVLNEVLGGKGQQQQQQNDDLCLPLIVSAAVGTIKGSLSSADIKLQSIDVRDDVLSWKPSSFGQIRDVVIHALNNSVDHGFLRPAQAGKSLADPVIDIKAIRKDDKIVLTVADNGAGIDLGALEKRAKEKGINVEQYENITDVVFLDGVSTAKEVTTTSGRGVGMSAIRDIAEKLEGVASISNREQGGTVLTLTIPASNILEENKTSQQRKSA